MKSHLIRRLTHQSTFTALAVITLAIGIGANTAIFAVVDSVLLRPLPFPHSEELIDADHTAPGVSLEKAGSAPFLYFAYREGSRTLEHVGLWRSDTDSLTGIGEPEEVSTIDVTEDILAALQVQPVLGRAFSKTDTTPGSPETVVLSYGFWQSKFGGDRQIIGRGVVLDGRPREIVGVMPQDFRFLDLKPALLVPLQLDPAKTILGNFSYSSIARLKPGVSLAEANSDAARLIPGALNQFPPPPGYNQKMFTDAHLAPAFRPLKQTLLGDIGKILWVLMGTVGMVLLIACANVTNLMFVRAQGRQHELAIRTALGASRWDVTKELLGECLALGILGGVAGLALADGALRLLVALAPTNLPRIGEISIDGASLLFTLGISLAAGTVFGLILSFKYTAPEINLSLRAGGRNMSHSREHHRARNALVVMQIALALVLLISSGLMIRTFQTLRHVDPGFTKPEQLQAFGIYIPPAAVKDPEAVVRMQEAILDKVSALPGVSSAAMTTVIPMTGNHWFDPIFAEDKVYADTQIPPLRRFKLVSPGLLKTMGNNLIVGRDFVWSDVYDKHRVVLVSENLARELWHDPRSAIGKRVRESLTANWREVIGVVSDERDDGVDQKAPTSILLPLFMDSFEGGTPFVQRGISFVVRSDRAGSSSFTAEVSRAVWSVNPNLPLASVRTLGEVYNKSMARTSFALVMLAIAGVTALLLGIAGIYGVVSYSVSQRTREVGIRRALGARNAQVTGMFVRQIVRLALIGIACGLVVAIGVIRLMSSLLFDVSSTDPITYIGVSLVLAVAAVVAAYIPALRANAINPIDALRVD